MKIKHLLSVQVNLLYMLLIILSSCIGTDLVEDTVLERIVIENPIVSLKVGEQHQFQTTYYDKFGMSMVVQANWSSSDESIATVNNGLVTAHKKGSVTITVSAEETSEEIALEISDETATSSNERAASLQTVSSYPLTGTAKLTLVGNKLTLSMNNDFNTTSALPGLYVYLSNSTSSTSSALEIGMVTMFSGAHSYEVPGSPGLYDYDYVLFFCKPFSVPVGYGALNP